MRVQGANSLSLLNGMTQDGHYSSFYCFIVTMSCVVNLRPIFHAFFLHTHTQTTLQTHAYTHE